MNGDPRETLGRLRLPAPRPAIAVTLLVALAVPILFFGLDDYSVVNADEAFYHDVGWTMLETHDWWRVRTGPGEHVYDTFANAPLQYWARGLVISLIGPGLFGMRILSAFLGLLSVLAVYALALRTAGRRAALVAGLLLLTNYQFVYLHSARTGELETGVALLLVLLVSLFIRAITVPKAGFVAHHLCLAVLVGWKAPVTPIPLLAELACFALIPAARPRLVAWVRTGILVLPFALAWHGWQAWRLRGVLSEVIATVGAQAAGTHRGSALAGFAAHAAYYAQRSFFGAWPQIVLFPATLATLSARVFGPTSRGAIATRSIAIYLAAVLGFYCMIGKVGPWYIVHAYPLLAVLIGIALSDMDRERRPSLIGMSLVALGIASLFFVGPGIFAHDPFAESAIRIPMPILVRGLGPIPASLAIVFSAAVIMVAASWVARGLGSVRPVVALMTIAILSISFVRTVAPLGQLDRTSAEAGLRADLDARLRADQPIPFPIDVPPAHPWITHYYFGHDFVLRAAPSRPGDPGPPRQRFTLTGERPPPAGSRAIR